MNPESLRESGSSRRPNQGPKTTARPIIIAQWALGATNGVTETSAKILGASLSLNQASTLFVMVTQPPPNTRLGNH